jgi:hypothetical protein
MFVLPALVLCVLLLTGCGGAGASPTGASPAAILVVGAVWKRRRLGDDRLLRDGRGEDLKEIITELGKHVQFFLRWRAEEHLKTQSDTDKVTDAVATEYDTVRAYVATALGPNPSSPSGLIKGTDKSPPHLDLDNVLRPFKTSPNPVGESKKLTEEEKRWKRGNTIVWRAAALEPRIWGPDFSKAAMDELLDRRLRIVERLWYQIDEKTTRGLLVAVESKPHGEWYDGSRVRMFEYPELKATERRRKEIGSANIGPGKVWREDPNSGQFVYAQTPVPWGTRIRKDAEAAFSAPPPAWWGTDYGYAMDPASGAKALDNLFDPAEDWWDRSWIFCDEVLAALHLDALRFAKLRRLQDNDASFNAALASHEKGWAGLRPVIGPPRADLRLIADDDAKPASEPRLFSNGPVSQLQLGDHVVFWNSVMYGLLSSGAWSLENAVVVDLESDWKSNDYGDKVSLMGHGTRAKSVGEFRQELAEGLNTMLSTAREEVNKAPPGADSIPWVRQGSPLVRWAPYGEPWKDKFGQNSQAPWWLRIPYEDTGDWKSRALGRDATKNTLPEAVEADPSPDALTGYRPPPPAGGGPVGACYFPLWVPTQEDRWQGYLAKRKAGRSAGTFNLEETTFVGDNIPGLVAPREFVPGGKSQHVYTARPYVTR